MSNWDDSDEEVAVSTAEIPIPTKQPDIVPLVVAKSAEDNPAAAPVDEGDDNDEDGVSESSDGSGEESDGEGEERGDVLITYDFSQDSHETAVHEVLNLFYAKYENIIAEFADVEIFLISVDGLLIELTSHWYLNWSLGGQTIIIAKQIDNLLTQLSHLGGKFKLVWMTDLISYYAQDTVLNFLRSFVSAHLAQSEWAEDVECFTGPLDPRWTAYLHQLTPSFLMLSTADASERVTSNRELKLGNLMACIALDTIAAGIHVVHLNGLTINLCSVFCHRVEAQSVEFKGWNEFMQSVWSQRAQPVERSVDLSSVQSTAELWSTVIANCKQTDNLGGNFDRLASAVLISALVGAKRGTDRVYLPETGQQRRGIIEHITYRRALLNACAQLMDGIDFQKHPLNFPLADIWDGRLIMCISDEMDAGRKILPYRIQTELAPLHKAALLECSLEVDTDDRLLEPCEKKTGLISDMHLLPVKSAMLNKYASDALELVKKHSDAKDSHIFDQFNASAEWPFHLIEEDYTKHVDNTELDNRTRRHLNKQRQVLFRWYENFAQSLEGRGSNLLVDFSRTPRGFAILDEDADDTKKKDKQWQQKGKGGKGKKEPVKSKKQIILEANKNKKSEKQVEDEKQMVKFATQQGKNALPLLETLMSKLELAESRARCVFEQMVRVAKEVTALEGVTYIEQRRVRAVALIEKMKQLLTTHWQHLDDQQRTGLIDLWVSLGFEKPKKKSSSSTYEDKRLTLDMNMVYYQLSYGGELIDIQSDPQKDSRVTGFHPDAWQRMMLDAVDRNHSAVIIAPTSAGKTFVSYYCIERVLRQSDDDMVVYVSPSKALLNQVCGSVYARFRNKTLSGGKSLFGTLTKEFAENTLNCQVLITVPECLELMLMSCNPAVQAVVNKIKFVIFDEVHCISASAEGHIWEHLLLLIRCPFLALSATIGNAEILHEWLQCAEESKTLKKAQLRKVELIRYGERYSELELCVQRIEESTDGEGATSMLEHFMPYGVYKPVKLSMFGIPDDQQLTARQILDLYYALAEVDAKVKEELEPCKFFKYHEGGERVWLSRADLRSLENALKTRFLGWLKTEPDKMNKVLDKLGGKVGKELEYRSKPFDQRGTAMKSIVPLVMELRDSEMLPAICFNDDRKVCEKLAERLCDYLEEQQKKFEDSAEYRNKYEIKDEEKMMKIAKRKRDLKEKNKTVKKKGGDKDKEREEEREPAETDDLDPLAAQKMRLNQVLEKFKLRGRQRDEDLFTRMKDRLNRGWMKSRESTKLLLKLFERGIGFHHQGLSSVERGAVEILFRSGQLAIVFSTSTLALGMNMPCKTVLFGVDTPFLTPLQFRQMSGRAGRRGYDRSGTVIFMSVPTAKIRRLLTAGLATLRGNLPFTTTFVLRLFSYVHQKGIVNDVVQLPISKGATTSEFDIRVQTALTLLENSFTLYTRKEMKGALESEIKVFTLFAVQLLRSLDLLTEKGEPYGMAPVVCHLSAQEPGNLLFVHLLQTGVFHRLCKKYIGDRNTLKSKLILIFANIFTNRRLPIGWNPEDRQSYPSGGDSKVFLDDVPKEVAESIEEYNARVDNLYRAFMQLGSPNGSIQGKYFSLAGNPDSKVSAYATDIVRPLHENFIFDEGLVPAHALHQYDHRGNKIWLNAYAVDFWRLKSKKAIEKNNNISDRETWFLIHDFSVTLEKIHEALKTVGRSKDPFVEVMGELWEEYDDKFRSSFGMKKTTKNA